MEQIQRSFLILKRTISSNSTFPFEGILLWFVPKSGGGEVAGLFMQATETPTQPNRRDFFKKVSAACIGAVLTLVPLLSGLAVFLDPLRRKAARTGAVRVAILDALPGDGVPRMFPVLASRTDAWNKFTQVPIGAVYLRRSSDNKLQAFNVVCPHAGCNVDFDSEQGHFLCPCHKSSFTVEGKIDNPDSPSPRGMDALEVEVRGGKEIWVAFQNFQTGRAEKIPVA
jgi:menaquinol-cytochrome c reductase iron-sulfur subunit